MGNSVTSRRSSSPPYAEDERENGPLPRARLSKAKGRKDALKDRSNLQPHVQLFSDHQKGIGEDHFAQKGVYSDMIPEPDYSDSEEELQRKMRTMDSKTTEEGLVHPKKLPNPCMESSQRINLHRELLFNQKMGKNVLNQKTELDRALEKMREDQKKKELEKERISNMSDFEKKLESQANKIKQLENPVPSPHHLEPQLEFLKVHARLCATPQAEHS